MNTTKFDFTKFDFESAVMSPKFPKVASCREQTVTSIFRLPQPREDFQGKTSTQLLTADKFGHHCHHGYAF